MSEPLRHHQLQLADVWVESVAFRRKERDPKAELTPVLRATLGRVQIAAEPTAFSVALKIVLSFPVDEQKDFIANVSIGAAFTSDEPLEPRRVRSFIRHSGLYILWPFARTHIASVSRMAGVSAPQLPLIVRHQAAAAGMRLDAP